MKKGKLSGILALIVIVTVLLEVTQPQFRAIWPSVVALVPVLIGAVFSGAVFGDHCSPISDTTIVSSIASGVDPMDHVRTQMPYALIAAVGAAITGFPISGISNGSSSMAIVSIALFVGILLVLQQISSRKQSKA